MNNKIKIGVVSTVVYPFVKGGSEKRFHEVMTRLAERGHEVTIYSHHWWDGPPEMEFEGMHLHAIDKQRELYVEGGRRSISGSLLFAWRTLTKIWGETDQHDVLVTSVAPYFHVFPLVFFSMLFDVSVVVIWHEVWDDYWDKHLDRMGFGGKVVERLVASIPYHSIAVSKLTADRLAAIGMARENISVIPNGVDLNKIREKKTVSDGFDVLFVGRLIEDKNVDMLLQAFDGISVDQQLKLGIIGDGPKRDALETQAQELSDDTDVTFLGFVEDYDEVLSYMQSADVFVFPSVREGFGITVLEAMASGCTVVTVDHPHTATSEVVADAGFVAEPTVAGLRKEMRRAVNGDVPPTVPQERAAKFDWDVIANQVEELYEEVI